MFDLDAEDEAAPPAAPERSSAGLVKNISTSPKVAGRGRGTQTHPFVRFRFFCRAPAPATMASAATEGAALYLSFELFPFLSFLV